MLFEILHTKVITKKSEAQTWFCFGLCFFRFIKLEETLNKHSHQFFVKNDFLVKLSPNFSHGFFSLQ